MIKIEFGQSWADTVARATREHGERGRRIATLLRAQPGGSKAGLCAAIQNAGYNIDSVLDWARRPYTSEGLGEAAQLLREYLEDPANEL